MKFNDFCFLHDGVLTFPLILASFQLEDFKIAQKEQEREIEKDINNRERDINCLKHYRGRCIEIVRNFF